MTDKLKRQDVRQVSLMFMVLTQQENTKATLWPTLRNRLQRNEEMPSRRGAETHALFLGSEKR